MLSTRWLRHCGETPRDCRSNSPTQQSNFDVREQLQTKDSMLSYAGREVADLQAEIKAKKRSLASENEALVEAKKEEGTRSAHRIEQLEASLSAALSVAAVVEPRANARVEVVEGEMRALLEQHRSHARKVASLAVSGIG
mmetsp:Transcript_21215/g.46092  ORF Transcript_21215/g.46092 Transcript_21215/m.46092 type:complete len:140 (-) Transcript_21215:112-531(-)